MYTVKKELAADRAERRNRNKNGANMPVECRTTNTGVQRVRTLHPTKGWRDRNVIWASRGINLGMVV